MELMTFGVIWGYTDSKGVAGMSSGVALTLTLDAVRGDEPLKVDCDP